MKNCPKCGASVEDTMNFCPNCHADCRVSVSAQEAGTQVPLPIRPIVPSQQPAVAQPGGTSKTKKIIGGICSFLVSVGVFFSCEYLLPWAEKEAEKEQLLKALQKFDPVFSDLTDEDLAADGDHMFRIFPSERESESENETIEICYFVPDIRIRIKDDKMEVIDKEKLKEYIVTREYMHGKGFRIEYDKEKLKETQREWDEDDEDDEDIDW